MHLKREEQGISLNLFLLYIKYTCFHSHLHPLTDKTSYHFSQESLPKEITRATSKSCIHHLLAVPVFEQRLLENMEGGVAYENDLNLKATELRLGLPGTSCTNQEQAVSGARNNKRPLPETREERGTKGKSDPRHDDQETAPAPKAQIVGWPPIRSYRKNTLQPKKAEAEAAAGMYVKVSMDGAPYLRKIDLKVYKGYPELLKALENMFKLTIGEYSEREGYKGSEYAPTYEDKDGDWMLIGDVPWDMFLSSCKKLRIIKGSEARD